jgi:hypothetical protein
LVESSGARPEDEPRLGAGFAVEINCIVIVSLSSPKEKIWGQLLALNSAGVTVRGIDLASFDDFLRQLLDHEEATVGLATVFYPMHRVERIAQDEPSGSIPSLADRFRAKIGLTVQEYLGLESSRT